LPLLAGFPPRLAIIQALAGQNLTLALVAVAGNLGLLIGGLRTLSVGVANPETAQSGIQEGWGESVYLVLGSIALFLVGLFPQWFLPGMMRMTELFTNLGR
jgi:formate hydrogenlyase subunit 3/multisubunit Na+/H+ antiporter MnhD subunit